MTNDIDNEYKEIDSLFQNGERIKSLKQHCNLIIKQKCPNDILIDYRKKLYSTFIIGEHGMDDAAIIMFKYAIEKCTLENPKFNIPFIKKAIYYLEQKNNPDYNMINNWLNYYDVNLLNNEVYGNNKYSDKELYYLKKAKILDLLNKKEDLEKILFDYTQEQGNDEILFFIKYHICRLCFVNASFKKANTYLKDILLMKREKYVLGLPIKYKDYTNQSYTALLIMELLIDNHLEDYFYAYILNWLKESKFKFILDKVNNCYKYENNKYKIIDYKKLKTSIILQLLNEKCMKSLIKCGKITKITKLRNAFILDGSSNVFVDKKYINKKIKVGDLVKYFVIEKYNNEKKCKLPQAVVINIGGNYEVLCSKKRK